MSQFRPPTWLAVDADAASIANQERILIPLNLTVLAAIAFVHTLFAPALGAPAAVFFVVLMGRFLMQACELLWLHGAAVERSENVLRLYGTFAVWLNIAFAFVLAVLGGMEDTHYVALMVIPVIAASFRYPQQGVAVTVAAVSLLTFAELWLYYRHHVPMSGTEYFEAANMVMVYAVVAAVVSFLATQLRRERSALAASLTVLRDTRDQLVTEEKLAAVGRLASAIAHEIRNPVGMIASSLAMMREHADPGRREELCGIAGEEAKRLERLTSEFLTFARRRQPERRTTSVAETLGAVAGLAAARAADLGLTIEVDAQEAGDADIDPFLIHQALLNLVVNALEASPAGSSVVLGASRGEDGLAITVANAGDAIADDVVPRLFEPFFTTKARGTGLGLAIARGIARDHGGDLTLTLNRPGSVRFSLTIPAASGEV